MVLTIADVASPSGRDPVTEKQLRPVAAIGDWGKQRERWAGLEPVRAR
jgi:hypothetical protein